MKSRVSTCKHGDCKRPYWRYSRTWPPVGFCSLECKEAHAKRHPPYEPERIPRIFVSLIRDHLETAHGTTDINAWFECGECERLAARYAESLSRSVEETKAE